MAAPKPKFNGLTDDQVSRILGQIATTVNLLSEMCCEKAEHFGTHDCAMTFHALDTMLRGVGALADMPSGGGAIGDFADWMVGPLFHQTPSTGGTA